MVFLQKTAKKNQPCQSYIYIQCLTVEFEGLSFESLINTSVFQPTDHAFSLSDRVESALVTALRTSSLAVIVAFCNSKRRKRPSYMISIT